MSKLNAVCFAGDNIAAFGVTYDSRTILLYIYDATKATDETLEVQGFLLSDYYDQDSG